jgi:hypothetical protein
MLYFVDLVILQAVLSLKLENLPGFRKGVRTRMEFQTGFCAKGGQRRKQVSLFSMLVAYSPVVRLKLNVLLVSAPQQSTAMVTTGPTGLARAMSVSWERKSHVRVEHSRS